MDNDFPCEEAIKGATSMNNISSTKVQNISAKKCKLSGTKISHSFCKATSRVFFL